MRRELFVASMGLAAVSLVGCRDLAAQREAKETQAFLAQKSRPVSTMTVGLAPINRQLEITGNIVAPDDTSVGSKVAGKLVSVSVKDGDPVSVGQALMEVDPTTYRAQYQMALAGLASARSQLSQAMANAKLQPTRSAAAVAQARAQVSAAQANLDKLLAGARPEERQQSEWAVRSAKTNLDTAKANYDRASGLYSSGAISKSDLDAANNAYRAAQTQYESAVQAQLIITNGARSEDVRAARQALKQAQAGVSQAVAQQRLDVLLDDQVRSAQAGVQSATAQVAVAKQALDDTTIRAPFAGRVSGKPAQVGAVVNPGSVVARLVGGQGIYFQGDVSETDIGSVAVGDTVRVSLDAFPKRQWSGVVSAISPVGQQIGRLFTVRVSMFGDTTGVSPNMFASGVVTTKRTSDAIVIPSTAILQKDGKSVVFVVEKSVAKMVQVSTGIVDGTNVQVAGLKPGSKIVTRGQETLYDDTPVTIEDAKAASANKTHTEGG